MTRQGKSALFGLALNAIMFGLGVWAGHKSPWGWGLFGVFSVCLLWAVVWNENQPRDVTGGPRR